MLRSRNRVRTASTGVSLTVTHGLGVVPDLYLITPLSARNLGCTYVRAASVLTNTIDICNSVQTTVTVDVFCWAYQGRLY